MARMRIPTWIRKLVPGKVFAAEKLKNPEGWAVLTSDVCAVLDPEGGSLLQRPWHEVATGDWDGERHTMTITWVDGGQPVRVQTADASAKLFPSVFKERVDESIVYFETEAIPTGGTLRAALRRTPEGELISQISSIGEVQQTPALEKQLESLERRLWQFVGI